MSEQAKPKKSAVNAYFPPAWEVADAAAFQALNAGEAEPAQQQRALRWVIELAAGTYDFHYYPNERDTAFALGRAFVGQQIVKMLKLNLANMKRL